MLERQNTLVLDGCLTPPAGVELIWCTGGVEEVSTPADAAGIDESCMGGVSGFGVAGEGTWQTTPATSTSFIMLIPADWVLT